MMLNQVKAHSPLLRVMVWAGVIVYSVSQIGFMVNTWALVETDRLTHEAAMEGTLAGCETDMECESAERAAKLAVLVVRKGGR